MGIKNIETDRWIKIFFLYLLELNKNLVIIAAYKEEEIVALALNFISNNTKCYVGK